MDEMRLINDDRIELEDWIPAFYRKACTDNRISATHTSLYFALLYASGYKKASAGFSLDSRFIMKYAKISSRVTYQKCLRELNQYGYIHYAPSYIPGESLVRIIELL